MFRIAGVLRCARPTMWRPHSGTVRVRVPRDPPRFWSAGRVGVPKDWYAEPRLAELNPKGSGSFSLYPPCSMEKGLELKPPAALCVRFLMWKEDGHLCVLAGDGGVDELRLPVFASDKWGYPALSALLKLWQEKGSMQWAIFRQYLLATGNAIKTGQAVRAPSNGNHINESGEQLDRKWEIGRDQRQWLCIIQK